MSSILQAPPARIPIGGPGGGPGGAPGGLAAALGGGPGGPPAPEEPDKSGSGSPTDLLRKALALVTQAADAEPDDVDTAGIHKIAADLSKAIAVEQQTKDAVSGAGPGVKMLRKASAGGGGGSY